MQNFPLLVVFVTDFTPFAPCSRLIPTPSLSILQLLHPQLVYSLLLGYSRDESIKGLIMPFETEEKVR
jgi:hypothetical protein